MFCRPVVTIKRGFIISQMWPMRIPSTVLPVSGKRSSLMAQIISRYSSRTSRQRFRFLSISIRNACTSDSRAGSGSCRYPDRQGCITPCSARSRIRLVRNWSAVGRFTVTPWRFLLKKQCGYCLVRESLTRRPKFVTGSSSNTTVRWAPWLDPLRRKVRRYSFPALSTEWCPLPMTPLGIGRIRF